jgi:hypothetical protein
VFGLGPAMPAPHFSRSLTQHLAFTFVFPGEVLAHPDVGPTFAAAGLVDAALEGVPGTVRIGGGGFGLPEQFAEVEKVLLGSTALGEIGLLLLGNEILGSHKRRGRDSNPR